MMTSVSYLTKKTRF